MIVRLDQEATAQGQTASEAEPGSDGAAVSASETDKLVSEAKQKIADGSAPAIGVSATNSGRGFDSVTAAPLEEAVEEEEAVADSELDGPEIVLPEEGKAEDAVKSDSAKDKQVL
jgi:protein phosphatase PTC1